MYSFFLRTLKYLSFFGTYICVKFHNSALTIKHGACKSHRVREFLKSLLEKPGTTQRNIKRDFGNSKGRAFPAILTGEDFGLRYTMSV